MYVVLIITCCCCYNCCRFNCCCCYVVFVLLLLSFDLLLSYLLLLWLLLLLLFFVVFCCCCCFNCCCFVVVVVVLFCFCKVAVGRDAYKGWFVGVSRGNAIRGNRTERFWEGNLPLRGSLRGSLRGRVSEGFRGFQRFLEVLRGFERSLEVFRGFQRFSEVFRGFSKTLSETLSECHFLSELRVVLPLIVLPLKTPASGESFLTSPHLLLMISLSIACSSGWMKLLSKKCKYLCSDVCLASVPWGGQHNNGKKWADENFGAMDGNWAYTNCEIEMVVQRTPILKSAIQR